MLSPNSINLIFENCLGLWHTLKDMCSSFHKRFIAPFQCQDGSSNYGNLFTVNNKQVLPISSDLPSLMGRRPDREKGNEVKFFCIHS